MKIGKNELKIAIADIETLKECAMFGFYDFENNNWHIFEISKFQNDLYAFVKFYNKSNWDRIVWYNGIDFDTQVIQYILNNYQKWYDLTNFDIYKLIYDQAQKVIENKKYGIFNEFREESMEIKPIDVYTVLGLDNEARRSSLKKCAFQLDEEVEEMPIHHSAENLTLEDLVQVREYMKNDILVTYKIFNITIGNTDHPIYKGNNQLELRADIEEEFGIDCINYSDIKIGDELLKVNYAKAINKDVKDLPKKGFFRKEIKLKHCIPKYVQFQTEQLKKLLVETKAKVVGQQEKHEVEFSFKNTVYTIGLGGGHSDNTSEVWQSDDDYQIVDLDVGSLYPAIIVNNNYYPYHLGKELLNVYKKLYLKRIELKPLAKKDKKINGIVGAIKLILNSAYGKMGSMDSWMYDKQVQVSVCLTGQFALLMLIESLELEGIHVFSFNTDGITLKLHKDKVERFKEICEDWENKTNFILERVDYKKIFYSTVNDYIAITNDGKVKTKGDFLSDFELWKNKSNRVVALALQDYFVKGTKPEDFIRNHKNIYDFCIMSRATGDLYLEMQNDKNEIIALKKLVRYYYSKGSNWQLFKRGIGSTGKPMNVNQAAPNDLGTIYIEYFNKFVEKPFEEYQIDLNQYIYKCYRLIAKVEKNKKDRHFITSLNNSKQLSLF
jgi:hypothetical protein